MKAKVLKNESGRVLITSARNIMGYSLVYSLGRRGIPVYCADYQRLSASFFSRFCSGFDIYPNPFSEPDRFMERLVDIIRKRNIDILIPATDETYLIIRRKDELPKDVKLFLPTESQLNLLHDKASIAKLSDRLGSLSPHTVEIYNKSHADTISKDFHYPVLLKPVVGGGAWGIMQVNHEKDFSSSYQELCNNIGTNRIIAQEFICGDIDCVALLCVRGEVKAHVCYRQMRMFPLEKGSATLRESVENSQALQALTKILEHIGWHGVCQADFVVDEQNQKSYLIDINPRVWGSIYQTVASGVDFPYYIYKSALEEEITHIPKPCLGVQTRWFWGDLRGYIKRFELESNKAAVLYGFFTSFKRAIHYDDFHLDDPLPFFIFPWAPLVDMIKQGSMHPERKGM